MEPTERSQDADNLDARLSFRKPSNDASGRNYRRYSPVGGSDASLSDGSPRHGRKTDTFFPREDHPRKGEKKRREDMADMDRDHHRRTQRDDGSHRHAQTHTTSHNYYRNESRDKDRRGDCERSYYRSSKFSHDSKDGDPSPYRRKDDNLDRSSEVPQKSDKYYKDKSIDGPINDDKNVNRSAFQRHGYGDCDSALHGRHVSKKEDDRATEYDRHRDRRTRDDKRERHRSPENYKSNPRFHDEVRGHVKDSSGRDFHRNEEMMSRRKRNKTEYDRDGDSYGAESVEHIRNARSSSSHQERDKRSAADEAGHGFRNHSSPQKKKSDQSEGFSENAQKVQESKEGLEAEGHKANSSKFSSEHTIPSINQIDLAPTHGAATVAAMKAAEIVNRNLMGGGLSITEQKKKLLWGNKKNTEESTSQWDLSLFPDRERQEKFKKLMSLSLPWYMWPIVGREGRPEAGGTSGRQGWQPPSEEAGGATDGSGEAIHCRSSEEGWPNSWPRSVTTVSRDIATLHFCIIIRSPKHVYFICVPSVQACCGSTFGDREGVMWLYSVRERCELIWLNYKLAFCCFLSEKW